MFWYSFYLAVILLMLALGTVLALTIGGVLYYQDKISLGTVYLILNYITLVYLPLEAVTNNFQELQLVGVSITRIEELLAYQPTIRSSRKVQLSNNAPKISFENVSFMYDSNGKKTLENITFMLYPKQVLGLIGRTGSGKTTLVRLLFRLYDPTQGKICLNGQDICDIDLYSLRKMIGYVTQDVHLFHASISNNITFFDKDIPDSKIISALEELGLSTWFHTLEDGLDTILGSESRGVSGGQAQLIALTRIFLKDAKIIIMYEESSRLDPISERFIQTAIDKLTKNSLVIIITHHLPILQRVDKILVLEDGHVAEFGDRISLQYNNDSKFYQIIQIGLDDTWA